MNGTLELICGPRGSGKSTSIQKTRAYTYTTRDKRPKEVEGIDRRFVTESEFTKLLSKGEILVAYEHGHHRYGYSKDLAEALLNGETVSEQIVPYDAAMQVSETYSKFGKVHKQLNLTFIHEALDSVMTRDMISPEYYKMEKTYKAYQDNFTNFDKINFRFFNEEFEEERKRRYNIIFAQNMLGFIGEYFFNMTNYATGFLIRSSEGKYADAIDFYKPREDVKKIITTDIGNLLIHAVCNDLIKVSENREIQGFIINKNLPSEEKKIAEYINKELFDELIQKNHTIMSMDLNRIIDIKEAPTHPGSEGPIQQHSRSLEYLNLLAMELPYNKYREKFEKDVFIPCHMAENYAIMGEFKSAKRLMTRCYGKPVNPRMFEEWNKLPASKPDPDRITRLFMKSIYKRIKFRFFKEPVTAIDKEYVSDSFEHFCTDVKSDAAFVYENLPKSIKDVASRILHRNHKSFDEYYHKKIKPILEQHPMIFGYIDLDSAETIDDIFHIKVMQFHHSSDRENCKESLKAMQRYNKISEGVEQFLNNLNKLTTRFKEMRG